MNGKHGKIDPEGGAHAWLAFKIYPTAMSLNNSVTDTQAKPCTPRRPGCIKWIEDARLILFWDTNTCIGDAHDGIPVLFLDGNGYDTTFALAENGFIGIVDNIDQDLLDLSFVGIYLQRRLSPASVRYWHRGTWILEAKGHLLWNR